MELKIDGWVGKKNNMRNANRKSAMSENEGSPVQKVKIFCELGWKYFTCVWHWRVEESGFSIDMLNVWFGGLQFHNGYEIQVLSLSLFFLFISFLFHLWNLRSTRKQKSLAMAFGKLQESQDLL